MWLLAAIVAYAVLRFGPVLRLPFLFDDYTILEKVRRHSLPELWAPRELLYGWYRPWSRETHFWALSHAFGVHPLPFHVASLVLWIASMGAFATLVRRVAGERAAVIAACGLAANERVVGHAAVGGGAQELWMVLLALLALHALLSRRGGLAALALAGALVSKETACVVRSSDSWRCGGCSANASASRCAASRHCSSSPRCGRRSTRRCVCGSAGSSP
jgi:hypothetical protein